jgi:DNA-binding CsgD family transcriptional regulator/PAS domain-containing protein
LHDSKGDLAVVDEVSNIMQAGGIDGDLVKGVQHAQFTNHLSSRTSNTGSQGASGAVGKIFQGQDIWPEQSLLKSVFYNEFLKVFDVCEMAGLASAGSGGVFDVLSIYRGPHEVPFDKEHFATLQTFVPHLQTALALRRRLLALKSRVSDLENAFDQLETALILVDVEAKPIFVNRAARQICDQKDGLYMSTSRLAAEIPAENGRLREVIAKAILAGRSKSLEHGGAILISRGNKRPLQILAAPRISHNRETPKGAVAVVFISDPELKPALRSNILRQLYGLTHAEARLALSLLDGKSLTEAADSIGVAHETVRSQVKSVSHKTGPPRQGELIRLLSSLPGQTA